MPPRRRRIGTTERTQIDRLVSKLQGYRVFRSMRRDRETQFNNRLLDYLRQNPHPLNVNNRNIPSPELFGETFRPEFYLKKGNRNTICAVECKKITERHAKFVFKAGLSQALIYSTIYKYVVLVYFDFTRRGDFVSHLGRGNRSEVRFIRGLRRRNVRIIFVSPVD